MEVPQIADPAQLISLAKAFTCAAAGRYRQASEAARSGGRHDLAELFHRLADDETAQLDRIKGLPECGSDLQPLPATWMNAVEPLLPRLDPADLLHALPYAVMAEAVRDKQRSFRLYSFLAAQSEHPRVQGLAEALAKTQLQAAHQLRKSRRKAFHEARRIPSLWPEPREIDSLGDLLVAAEAAETLFVRLVERQSQAGSLVEAILRATRDALPEIEPAADARPAGERVALKQEREDGGNPGDLLDQALQAFAFYDAVAGQAKRPEVLEKAQALTAMALSRIELLCGTKTRGP